MFPSPARRLHPVPADAPPPSPEQEAFDTLQRRIQAQRELLAQWQAAVDDYERRYARELRPLLDDYRQLHIDLLERLDHAASGGLRLGRTDAHALHALIVDIAESLLIGEDDEALQKQLLSLRDKYAEPDDDSHDSHALGHAAPTADDAGASAEPTLEDWETQQAQAEAQRAQERAAHRREAAARKKQREPEAVQAHQSLRAVYRQLVSLLHPDREPDEQERLRKTALMQRVNEAYAAQRLSDLLQLQQEVASADAARAAQAGALPTEKLAAYNRLLSDQLKALQQQVRELEADFKARHRLNPHGRLKPATLSDHLRVDQAKLNNSIRAMQREAMLLEDPEVLKQWVKAQRKMAAG